MKQWMRTVLLGLTSFVVLAGAPAAAQEAPEPEFVNGRPVWENARGGAVIGRRPGRMVQAGTGRFNAAHNAALNRAQSGPEITETEPAVDRDSALRAGLLTGFFESFNSMLQLLSAAIGTGLGLPDDTTDPGGPGATDVSDLLGTITGRG